MITEVWLYFTIVVITKHYEDETIVTTNKTNCTKKYIELALSLMYLPEIG